MCTEPMVVHPAIYEWTIYSSTAVVVVCAVLLYGYGVWSLPKGVCGLVQMDTCYHYVYTNGYCLLCSLSANYIVPIMVLCALGHVY